MKRLTQYLLFLLLLILVACSRMDKPTEWINVANYNEKPITELYKITDRDQINNINELTGELKWQDRQIETSGTPDYAFWLERDKEELKITSYEIWFDERGYSDSAVIVEYIQGKFATIDRVELEQLIQFLEQDLTDKT